ncbi:MAG: DNA recombination protein RmuC [Elusimicrobiota bacterium]
MSVEQLALIFLFSLGIITVAFLVWFIKQGRDESRHQVEDITRQILDAQKNNQSMEILQREMIGLRDQLAKSVQESAALMVNSQKSVGERLDRAAEVVGKVQKSLGALDQATQQVFMVGKDIAQLQEILRAPKVRGTLGELFLSDLLGQILPATNFTLQHTFKTGETVDAIVRLGSQFVPVDSKFPLENFKRLLQSQDPQEKTMARKKFISDVKKHIDSIASKYILPDEGTFDFALMYIPAENVYYETIIKDDATGDDSSLMTYAFSKRVMPVSPNSFYAYLHTISLGLRGMKIEENARHVMDHLDRLRGDFGRFKEDFSLIGKHLSNSRSKYEDAEKRLYRLEDKLSLPGSSPVEPVLSSAQDTIDQLKLGS